ncbi:hypothetical protein Tco_1181226 [Tanacetum coccineum]
MLLNVDQLQKQLDKDEFQEDGSMTAFWVVNNQFQKFINSKFTLDYDSQMTDTYFVEYTGLEVQHFRDTLLQHLSNVKKSIAERTRHQRQYERRVNKRQMQTQESKIDTGKALDADLVDTESIRTDSTVQDDSSRHIFAIRQQHTEQPEIIVEGRVDQYPETCQVKSPMLDSSPDNQTTEYSKQSLESENILLKETVAQFQKDFSRMEAHCIALELNIKIQSLKSGQHGGTTEQTTSLLANNAELKAQIQEKVFAIAALKNDLRKLKGNTKKKIQERDRNSTNSVPTSARIQTTTDDSKPNPRSNNQTSRSLPVSKSSRVTITAVPKADHSKSSSSFSDSKNFVCSTCHKCVFNANHDACITKLLKEVNSRAKAQSNKTTNSNKPVDQKSHTQKPGRQIFIGHRFSPNTTSAVYEKTSPRSDLSKVDSEPPHGSNVDIHNIHACKQTLDVSAGTSINVQKEQSLDLSAEVHQAAEIVTMSNELDLLFGPLFNEYFNGENQVVLKSSAVTTTDASNKRQQQLD